MSAEKATDDNDIVNNVRQFIIAKVHLGIMPKWAKTAECENWNGKCTM